MNAPTLAQQIYAVERAALILVGKVIEPFREDEGEFMAAALKAAAEHLKTLEFIRETI